MEGISNSLIAIVSGIIGLAIVAVLVSQKAQTGTVLQSAGGALSSIIAAAVSPVTGQSSAILNPSGQNAFQGFGS